jgi:ketol-acid reductoisomerase
LRWSPFEGTLITALEDGERIRSAIRDKTIGVIGYGNQGRSQALNLRDSGLRVIVGNRGDEYARNAEADGFRVYSIGDAVAQSQIVLLLIPDEVAPEVFEEHVSANLRSGAAVVFASAYNYFYGYVRPPPHVDVLLLAPRMIGFGVRELYQAGRGFPVLVAVDRDSSGHAWDTVLGLADAVGALRPGGVAVKSSFREETLVDLLSEQTWAGALLFLFRAYYEVATQLGASPEAVILELYGSGELAEVAASIRDQGLFKQLDNHSHTSQYGQLSRGPMFADSTVKQRIMDVAQSILDGTFAREWSLEQQSGMAHYKRLRELAAEHEMEAQEHKLYRALGRIGNRTQA